ncbi:hypothetical protein GPECTOR_7g1111 [Gonium pectorale]|uniref:BRX domain-containing protein n=1 Tax=Gonium pectorale TaxID=33097 RepID=A0A150GU47_GONPE|nr:hypothetical protein GPECTOR_7g1111 [Gonium pectorale]|eukprot:KXZ53218.1 hypothetical protein GPECTOR_7g1111 [Gonium pectorale]
MEALRGPPERSSSVSESLGALYTWGGDFSWLETPNPSGKRDHNNGCLGHGDKEGRLLPTRVRGDLDKHGVVQVTCGWSMTVALSADGRVYQMGATGASGDKGCAWEGALTPTRVDGNLFGMFVEEVTCGMHHVVVIASKVQANGQIAEDQRRVRLLTWGRGTEGQLGVDKSESMSGDGPVASRLPPQVDYTLPQVVSAVDGKRVLHVSAGGNHTMAVIEHDPRGRRAPPQTPAATPSNPYGNGALATPGGNVTGGGRSAAHMQGPSMAGALPSRDGSGIGASASAASLLGMSSPFTIAQALPMSAAAGLQTLQQMVGTVVPRSKLSTPSGNSASRVPSRRHQGGSRMVAIPAVSHRSDLLTSRNDLRRSMARAPQPVAVSASVGALPGHGHFPKSQSVNAKLQAEPSASSSMVSHHSSPPMVKGQDEADSRSLSPSSSMLYEVGSSLGELQPGQSARERAGSAGASAAGEIHSHGHGHGQDVAGGAGLGQSYDEGNAMAGLGGLSLAGLSTMEMEAGSEGYFRGRSLDMVPEQYVTANGGAIITTRGQEPYVDSPESVQQPSTPAAVTVHPSMPLAHGGLTQPPPMVLPGGDSSGAGAAAASGSTGTGASAGLSVNTQLLPPPPLHIHHAMSLGHPGSSALASPSGHGLPPLGPMSAGGVGGPMRASTLERQAVAEADEEGLDEDEDEDDDEDDNGSVLEGEGETTGGEEIPLPPMHAPLMQNHGSMRRYTPEQGLQPQPQHSQARMGGAYMAHPYEHHQHVSADVAAAAQPNSRDGSFAVRTDTSEHSGSSDDEASDGGPDGRPGAVGVFLNVRQPTRPGCKPEVVKVRFSKRVFGPMEAHQWLAKHKIELNEQFHLTSR